DSIYTIPVVVHVIYPPGEAYGSSNNISYAQIRSQIEALNAAFSKSYTSYNGQLHPDYAHNAKIRFCLARISSPNNNTWAVGPGGIEYGVMRYADNSGAYNHDMSIASVNQLLSITHSKIDYFPFDKYLNIWLVKTIAGGNNVMGYAPKPLIGSYPLDGIVMRADIFGDNTTGGNFNLGFNLMQGKILAHEMGHYLNLYHIFQNGCAGTNGSGATTDACDLYGDYICDTKPCTTQNVLCGSGNYTTCSVNYNTGTTNYDMINDYMSYADDDCMNTFTLNQSQRMWATLQLQRRNLWQASNLAATGVLGGNGCVPSYLNATVSVDDGVFCAGTSVRFSNPKSGNTATIYQWQFPGGLPSTSNKDTVTVIYTNPGNYKAILTVGDANKSRSDSLLFTVVTCKLDSSLQYMAHWYFGDYCSLDFSSGTPVKTTTALTNNSIHSESAYTGQMANVAATISLSDSTGKLLFYSNGASVWNNNHKKITTAPIFGKSDINWSNGICYIPFPGQPNKYFIVGAYPNLDWTPLGIRFVLVDVAANSVSPYQEIQNALLPKRFSEFLTVVPHCNGTDYWIIVKGKGQDSDNNFYSILVNSLGINVNQTPVVSSGFFQRGYGGSGNQLKANNNGDKLLLTSSDYCLYDFDTRSGKVSNEKFIPGVNSYGNVQSGAAFSPNGDYFYVMRTSNFSTGGKPYCLFQYRVSDLKYNMIPTTGFYFSHPFQLGPDNQLYINNTGTHLARLSEPNNWGGATFNDEFMSFSRLPNVPQPMGASLPAFIDAKRKLPTNPDYNIKAITCNKYEFTALCFDDYLATWDFGDSSSNQTGNSVSHLFTTDGEFKVKLTLSKGNKTYGTITKKVTVLPLSIAITGPDSVCNTNNFATQYFANTNLNVQYQWSAINGSVAGADNVSYVGINWSKGTLDSGILQLRISTNENCVLNLNKRVAIVQGPTFNWFIPDSICADKKPIILKTTPSGGVFKGNGVINGIFTPSSTSLGNHILTYNYGMGTICNNETQKIITVTKGCSQPPPLPPASNNPPGLAMPTAFTPNKDGLNDLFRIPKGLIAQLQEFSVYHRWGNKVFTTQNINNGWDGNIKGLPAEVGTYIFLIIGTATNGLPIALKGTVVLIR
ncbi:MAG: gliding motility-associated C-terminal domain-containing protein, partial [Deinococcales bacterium]|nr:gliding motility-associated C-terminal domain-containing protein [Chitinophagaceae bacterium]